MIAAIFDFFIDLIWILPFISIGFLIPSFYCVNSKSYGKSTIFMLISAGLAAVYFWSDIKPLFAEHGTTISILFLTGCYILAGLVTSFVYWIFYIWKAKERFESLVNKQSTPSWAIDKLDESQILLLKQYLVIDDVFRRRQIFDDPDGELNINVPDVSFTEKNDTFYQDLDTKLKASIASVLPPRFATCKLFIIGAGCSWPITIIWLLVSRVVKQLIERFVSLFGSTYDKISKLAFGKF